jgi:hypothetical protein
MAPCASESLLCDVLGDPLVPDDHQGEPEDTALETAHEGGDGVGVSGRETGEKRFV